MPARPPSPRPPTSGPAPPSCTVAPSACAAGYRNGVAQALAPAGGQWPMGSAAVDPLGDRAVRPADVGDNLAAGHVVISAHLRRPVRRHGGRHVVLRRWSGGPTRRHRRHRGRRRLPAELVLSTDAARAIGFVRPTSVQIYGFKSVRRRRSPRHARAAAVRRAHRVPTRGAVAPDSTLGCWTPRSSSASSGSAPRQRRRHHRSGVGSTPTSSDRPHRDPDRRPPATGSIPRPPGGAHRDRAGRTRRRHRHRQHQPLRRLLLSPRGSPSGGTTGGNLSPAHVGAWRST